MKTKYWHLLFLPMVIITGFIQENNKQKLTGKKEQTEMLVNSREFVFHARRIFPSRMASIDLTTNPGYVKFSRDLIESSMPFFGRAYSGIGYGGDSGLHFKGQPETFDIVKKGRKYNITSTVKSGNDNFQLFLTVMPEGDASLSISSNNRETISYSGEIRAPEKKE